MQIYKMQINLDTYSKFLCSIGVDYCLKCAVWCPYVFIFPYQSVQAPVHKFKICMHITVNNWVIATFSKHIFYLYHNSKVTENFLTTKTVKRKSGRQPRDNVANASVIATKNEQGKATYFKTYLITKLLNYKVLRYSLQQKGNLSTQSTQCIIPYNIIYLFNNSVQDAGWIMCR